MGSVSEFPFVRLCRFPGQNQFWHKFKYTDRLH